MKKFLNTLFVGVISICLIGCAESNPVKDATLNHLRSQGSAVTRLMILNVLGETNAKIDIVQWNNTPIDTITKGDFYKYELNQRIKAANNYKLKTLYQDSIEVVRNKRNFSRAYSDYSREMYKDWLNRALETQKKHQQEYKKQVDAINQIKAMTEQTSKDEVVYVVYQFTERVDYQNPITKEHVNNTNNGFSYVNLILQAVTYVAEEGEYDRHMDKLTSPIKIRQEEEEVQLL